MPAHSRAQGLHGKDELAELSSPSFPIWHPTTRHASPSLPSPGDNGTRSHCPQSSKCFFSWIPERALGSYGICLGCHRVFEPTALEAVPLTGCSRAANCAVFVEHPVSIALSPRSSRTPVTPKTGPLDQAASPMIPHSSIEKAPASPTLSKALTSRNHRHRRHMGNYKSRRSLTNSDGTTLYRESSGNRVLS